MAVDNRRFDLALDKDGDLLISVTGDFVLLLSDFQIQQDNIIASPGSWKEYPDNGCNIQYYQNGPINVQSLTKNIQLQLQADGYNIVTIIGIDANGKLVINIPEQN